MGGEKCAKQIFQKHMNSARNNCWEKNRRKKVRQIVFYIHTNIVFKKRGQKIARNTFCRNTQIVREKCWEKIVRKSAKNVFYIHTNTVTKKRGQKLHETNFPETHE